MKKARIAINGFGRIGRLNYRAAWDWPALDWVLINDPKGGAECDAHLLTFDSVEGRWAQEAVAEGKNTIRVGDRRVAFTEYATPGEVDWAAHGVDIVLECSGKFRTPEQLAPYFERGVKKDFVDCGGTVRQLVTCLLQTWVGDDGDHRITAGKLLKAFEHAGPILRGEDLPVELEYETCNVVQLTVTSIRQEPDRFVIQLGSKHTDCLAKELYLPSSKGDAGACC